jgi:hypothetical protein
MTTKQELQKIPKESCAEKMKINTAMKGRE